MIMGCYGIGVSRLISAVIEQNHDEQGIIWPREVSPYQAIILPLDITDAQTAALAQEVYDHLEKAGIDTLLDDRDERAGVKFKDADLLGISLQVIIGRDAVKNDTLELKARRDGKKIVESKTKILKEIVHLVQG
jgi:prolyl-tRNA synthetase